MKSLRESGYFKTLSFFLLLSFLTVFVILSSFSFPFEQEEDKGEVLIITTPEGASIFIDGEDKGLTPFQGFLKTGKHKVKIEKEGFEPIEREIVVEKGKKNIFDFTFASLTPAKEIPIEKKVEEKPMMKERIEKPRKSTKLLYIVGGLAVAGVAGYFLLRGGKKEEKKEEDFGSIDVKSDPTGARIYLDGSDTGRETDTVLTNVKVGTHSITLKKPRCLDYNTNVTVYKNQTAKVDAKLLLQSLYEDFNDGVANDWVDNGFGPWRVENGVYVRYPTYVLCHTKNSYAWHNYGYFKDFTYQADIKSEDEIGLSFRWESYSGYIFAIDSYKFTWTLYTKESSGGPQPLKSEKSSAIRRHNWNTLKVVASGSKFTFYINEVMVGSYEDSKYSIGKVGIFLNTYPFPVFPFCVFWPDNATGYADNVIAVSSTSYQLESPFRILLPPKELLIERSKPEKFWEEKKDIDKRKRKEGIERK